MRLSTELNVRVHKSHILELELSVYALFICGVSRIVSRVLNECLLLSRVVSSLVNLGRIPVAFLQLI